MSEAGRLADQLWDQIPAYASPENMITLPAPLVLEILRYLRIQGRSGGQERKAREVPSLPGFDSPVPRRHDL